MKKPEELGMSEKIIAKLELLADLERESGSDAKADLLESCFTLLPTTEDFDLVERADALGSACLDAENILRGVLAGKAYGGETDSHLDPLLRQQIEKWLGENGITDRKDVNEEGGV
ncbi:MAG: hypothetical protein ABFD77_02600, partial [Thermotogota bacterium]